MQHSRIYQKVIFHLSVFGLMTSILVGFYDVIFHTILELCHGMFEIVEMGLDKLIEHTFETEMRETQIIVFYLMLLIGGGLAFYLWKMLVQLFSGTGHYLRNDWLEFKGAITQDWQSMSMATRVICILLFLLINYLASFFLF